MNKLAYLVIGLIGVGLVVLAVIFMSDDNLEPIPTNQQPSQDITQDEPSEEVDTNLPEGRYMDYSDEAVSAPGYQTILFFYASWCPECRGFELAINEGTVPDGYQILKVDFDDSQQLRKRYGVTIQTSFVSIDMDGDRQTLWVGDGREKSIQSIIDNT